MTLAIIIAAWVGCSVGAYLLNRFVGYDSTKDRTIMIGICVVFMPIALAFGLVMWIAEHGFLWHVLRVARDAVWSDRPARW